MSRPRPVAQRTGFSFSEVAGFEFHAGRIRKIAWPHCVKVHTTHICRALQILGCCILLPLSLLELLASRSDMAFASLYLVDAGKSRGRAADSD